MTTSSYIIARLTPNKSAVDVVDGQEPVVPESCVSAEPVFSNQSSEVSASDPGLDPPIRARPK